MTTIVTGQVVTAAEINSWCPSGMIVDFGGAAAPSGWLLCDGASYLRATYPDLFAAIGTTYGAADGTHFNVPDLRGRVPVGYAAAGGHADVSTLGNNDGVAAANRRAKHRHTAHAHTVHGAQVDPGGGSAFGALQTAAGTGDQATTTADGGSGNANDSLDAPAYIVLNKIIRALDV